jgi:hypothetical protein
VLSRRTHRKVTIGVSTAILNKCRSDVANWLKKRLEIFSDPDKFIAAAPFTFLLASLLVLILGAGKLSADGTVGYILEHRGAKQPERSIVV